MKHDIDLGVENAKGVLRKALQQSKKQIIAFSGGKDAIVTAHIAAQLGIHEAVCETSFYFQRQLDDIKKMANILGLNVHWENRLDLAWLRKNKRVIFSSDSKVRSWTYAERQQKTIRKFSEANNFDCQIFGRRTEENTVKDVLYKTAAGLQCHPIRSWSTEMVWEYMKIHNLPVPWIYSTRVAEHGGNGPFYSMQAKNYGGEEACWQIVSSLDPRYTRQNILG